MAQGALPFQYEAVTVASGVTALGGLPVYLDLIETSGPAGAIKRHVRVAGDQGWLDLQMIVAVIVLNLAGGDGLEDLERDPGFAQVMRETERGLLSRCDRPRMAVRWRKGRGCTLPGDEVIWWLRALRQKRGSARRHEDLSGRWPDAVRPLRRQRRIVDDHDPGPH